MVNENSYGNFLELAKHRRSMRRFKPDTVPDESIEKIIEAARWAPSGYNSQPWEFLILKDNKLKEVVTAFDLHLAVLRGVKAANSSEERVRLMSQPWLDEDQDYHSAPAIIVLYGDQRARAGLPDMGKIDPTRTRLVIQSSLACAFVYMELAAASLGLATQWLGGNPTAHSELKKLLGMPDEFEPYAMMPLGYPAYKPRPKLLRDRKKMVHYDLCGKDDFRTDQEVADFARKTWIWTTATHRRGVDRK
jgi:nitroreductase